MKCRPSWTEESSWQKITANIKQLQAAVVTICDYGCLPYIKEQLWQEMQERKKNKTEITWKELRRQKVLIFWAAVFVIYGFIFCYLPLGGWLMAFQNYKPKDGILHSKFIGLAKFQQLFSDATFLRVIRNTLAMGVINLVLTFVMAIAFAILLNEVKSKTGKKTVQTISICRIFFPGSLLQGFSTTPSPAPVL